MADDVPARDDAGNFIMDVTCPWCGVRHDRVGTLTNDAPPAPGSLHLCIGCGSWAVFSRSRRLRKATLQELHDIGKDPHCLRAYRAWQRVVGASGAEPRREKTP